VTAVLSGGRFRGNALVAEPRSVPRRLPHCSVTSGCVCGLIASTRRWGCFGT